MPIALNEVQGVLEEKIFGSKRMARRAALTDSLAGVYKPLVDADGVAFLAERSRRRPKLMCPRQRPLCAWVPTATAI